MRLGKRVSWEEVEVGEVVAALGCVVVVEKVSDNKLRLLASDQGDKGRAIEGRIYIDRNCWLSRHCCWVDSRGCTPPCLMALCDRFYRLSVDVQALWKEE